MALEQLSDIKIIKLKMSEAALLNAIFEAGIAAVHIGLTNFEKAMAALARACLCCSTFEGKR
jgi:hypothetical protein